MGFRIRHDQIKIFPTYMYLVITSKGAGKTKTTRYRPVL